jgi:hypothetical protein
MRPQISPVVLNNLIFLKDAADCSGYNLQYIRRLLRLEKLAGLSWVRFGRSRWALEFDLHNSYNKILVNFFNHNLIYVNTHMK